MKGISFPNKSLSPSRPPLWKNHESLKISTLPMISLEIEHKNPQKKQTCKEYLEDTSELNEYKSPQCITTLRWRGALNHTLYVTQHHDEALIDKSGEFLEREKRWTKRETCQC